MTPEPCASKACAEADPLSPCVCRCGGWGHAFKTHQPLLTHEDMAKPRPPPNR